MSVLLKREDIYKELEIEHLRLAYHPDLLASPPRHFIHQVFDLIEIVVDLTVSIGGHLKIHWQMESRNAVHACPYVCPTRCRGRYLESKTGRADSEGHVDMVEDIISLEQEDSCAAQGMPTDKSKH